MSIQSNANANDLHVGIFRDDSTLLSDDDSFYSLIPHDSTVAYEMSRLLNTGVDREQLSILISLCENGVNPEVRPSCPPFTRITYSDQAID